MKKYLMYLCIAVLLTFLGSAFADVPQLQPVQLPNAPNLVPILQEDLIPFSWQNATVQQIGGRWKVVDGNMWLLDFNTNEANARKALSIIKFYKMNKQGFVGRPNPPMQYYLANGIAPAGPFAGEDCLPFNTNNVEAKQINGTWKVVNGDHWMLDFGANEANARKAVAVIKKYGFNNICFVGRPNPPMMYFRTNVAPLKIEAKLSASPTKYTGAYPAVIKFSGTISVTRPTQVKYTFIRSDGATGPTYTLDFAQAGSKPVSTTWTIGKDYIGWEAIKVISPMAVESNKASFEIKAAVPPLQEDLIPFSWQNATVQQIGGRWKIVDGNMWLLDFNTSEAEARKALSIIKFYHMNTQGFVGRPNAPMQYYLVNGASPVGAMTGEDCISFNINNIEAKQINGAWKVVDGDHWMLDFGANEANARKAVAVIKKYGFNRICYVGRPGPSMMYLRK